MNNNYKLLALILTFSCIGLMPDTWAQNKPSAAKSASSGDGDTYSTSLGFRGGLTSGITIKHFISSNSAIEGIVGTRWRGLNIAGLYEIHKRNALGVSRLSWEYGLGARIGFYDGKYYREWNTNKNYGTRSYTAVSILGILGLEYYLREIPFTIGLDIMPYLDIIDRGQGFLDGSAAIRYVF